MAAKIDQPTTAASNRRRPLVWVAWTAWLVASFVMASLIGQLIYNGATQLLNISLDSSIEAIAARLVILVLLLGLFMGVPMLLWQKNLVALRDAAMQGGVTWLDIGLAVTGFILYLLMAAGAISLAQYVPGFNLQQAQDLGIPKLIFGGERLFAFMVFVVFTPIIEEVLFRGLLYTKLRQSGMPVVAVALVVSVLFAAAHGQWNVAIDVFCLSMVACAIRQITQSVWGPILLHMIKNGIAFYVVYVLGVSFGG